MPRNENADRDCGPLSPCINVCVIGADGSCNGCSRTLAEIAGWLEMGAAEQWAVMARLDERRASRRSIQRED
ncbi:MAG: DUF1289 domain-containing protein [Steroidobacteraceae bacterium]